MGDRLRSVLIVTLGIEDIEDIERRIVKIRGVQRVDFNHLTHKLFVRYESDEVETRNIDLEIRKILKGKIEGKLLTTAHSSAKKRQKSGGV